MTKIKTTNISVSMLETALFTFMLCCSTMAMKKDDEIKEKSSHLVNRSKALSSSLPTIPRISDKKKEPTVIVSPTSQKITSFASSPVLSHKNVDPRSPLSRKISTPNSTSHYIVKESDSHNPLSPRSSSAPTSPSSSPRMNEARIPLSRKTSASNSPKTPDARIPLSRKISVSNPQSPSSSLPESGLNFTSPTVQSGPEVTVSSPFCPQSSNIKRLPRSKSATLSSNKVPRLTIPSTSQEAESTILSSNRSPNRIRKLSRENSHSEESGRTVYLPKFLQSIHDNLVDTLDNEMSKPAVLGGMGELQHLRWKFYCAFKKDKPIFAPNKNKIIEYIQGIEPKILLNTFWNIDVNTHLDDDNLINKLSFEDLELIGQSIEFLLDSDLPMNKSILYKSALRCYRALVKHSNKDNAYDYEVAKYATLAEDYELAYPHFLECITSTKLQLEHDAIWINRLTNSLFLDLEDSKKNNTYELDRPQCLFNIARLKDNMNKLMKADKPRYLPNPLTPKESKTIRPDELVFFYDKVLYAQFFDKPKMELDVEAVNFFLENEKTQDESSSSSEFFSMDTETISNEYKVSDLIRYIKQTVKGTIPYFINRSSTQEELSTMQPNGMILSYETVPYCQVFGKDKIQIHFDRDRFAKLMNTFQNGANIKSYQSMTEEWKQLIGSIASDGYNIVLNMNMEQMKEPDPEVTDLYLKSALLYYQGKNPWGSMKDWDPHILFSIAQASFHKIQEKNNLDNEPIEKFYYELMKFIVQNNKNNYKNDYLNIIKNLLNFPMKTSTLMLKRGEHFAEMGKIAFDTDEHESANKLYFEAANIFYKQKYALVSYKKLENDMIVAVISHALEQNDEAHKEKVIKDLSFYLVINKTNIKKYNPCFYESILTYFYETKKYVTYHNFIEIFSFQYSFSKECWAQYLKDVLLKYQEIQKNKKSFFEATAPYIEKLVALNNKPNESALKIFVQDLLTHSKFTKTHWDKLKTDDNKALTNYLSTLVMFAGIDKEHYKKEEEADYKERVFEILGLNGL